MAHTGNFFASSLIAVMAFVLPSVAVGASKEELRPVIEWVRTTGEPASIENLIAQALGIPTPNQGKLPVIQLGYTFTDSGWTNAFSLAMVNGRREVILQRFNNKDDLYYGWRMSEEATVIKSLFVPHIGQAEWRDGLVFEKEFAAAIDIFLARVPKAPVNDALAALEGRWTNAVDGDCQTPGKWYEVSVSPDRSSFTTFNSNGTLRGTILSVEPNQIYFFYGTEQRWSIIFNGPKRLFRSRSDWGAGEGIRDKKCE
jgi:hypothetical protein